MQKRMPVNAIRTFNFDTGLKYKNGLGCVYIFKTELRWETYLFPLGSKTVKCNKCGRSRRTYTEKGVDVAIATKMLTHSITKAFDTAILVSGDKDYLETIATVKNQGLRVEVVSFRHSLSKELGQASSAPVIYLDDIKSDILLEGTDHEADKLMGGDS